MTHAVHYIEHVGEVRIILTHFTVILFHLCMYYHMECCHAYWRIVFACVRVGLWKGLLVYLHYLLSPNPFFMNDLEVKSMAMKLRNMTNARVGWATLYLYHGSAKLALSLHSIEHHQQANLARVDVDAWCDYYKQCRPSSWSSVFVSTIGWCCIATSLVSSFTSMVLLQ